MEKVYKSHNTNNKFTMNPNTNNKITMESKKELYTHNYQYIIDDVRSRLNASDDADKVVEISLEWLNENHYDLSEDDKKLFCRKMVSLMVEKEDTYKGAKPVRATNKTITKINEALNVSDGTFDSEMIEGSKDVSVSVKVVKHETTKLSDELRLAYDSMDFYS